MTGDLLTVTHVSTPADLAALEPEWHGLFLRHGEGIPFRSWDWHEAWWAAFGASGSLVSDERLLLAVRDGAGELVGIAPMMLVRRPGRGPAVVRVVDFIGADPNITEIRGPLCDPRRAGEVHGALRDHLIRIRDEWDWLHWRGLPDDCPDTASLLSSPGVQAGEPVMLYILPLHGTWEAFRSSRSRNLKESLRKCTNSLRRDGITASFEVLTDPRDIDGSLGRLVDLHAMRARLEGTVTHPDVFASPTSRRFLADVVSRFAARGQARVFQLRIGGEVVAIRLGFAIGDSLYFYYSGYDPAWGRYSVMTTVVAEAIRDALTKGFRAVHLSTGTDVSKTRWHPQATVLQEAVQVSPTLRGKSLAALFRHLEPNRNPGVIQRVVRRVVGRRPSSDPT